MTASGGSRRAITSSVIKKLFGDSGGRCNFLGCATTASLPDGTNLLEVAHINSLAPGTPRYEAEKSIAELSQEDNLILLCPNHHFLVDVASADFPSARLRDIKKAHLKRVADLLSGQQTTAQANKLRKAVNIWNAERKNNKEGFWQKLFKDSPELLLPASAGRPFILNFQGYVGGKSVTGSGANLPDFIAQCDGNVVIVEIKTPATRLVGAKYRSNSFPPNRELAGACVQAMEYKTSLMNNLHTLSFHNRTLFAPHPIAVVVAGDTQNPTLSEHQRRSFELFRHSLKDVTVLTYDELFRSIDDLATMMEDS